MFTLDDRVSDWQDLQSKVAQLFQEIDYEVETPKIVELAGRGKKEIDVWVKDPWASVNQIYLVECKFWSHRVPQEIVHAFKTVMEGAGANTGFIVSKVGFQKGAYEAVRFTNIHLLTFEELQHVYGNEWFRKQKRCIDALTEQLVQAASLHFDQSSILPIPNNMFFHSKELSERLHFYNGLNRNLVGLATGRHPESYLGPEPIEATSHPFDPFITWESRNREAPYIFQSVRQFFQDMVRALNDWIEDFEQLRQEAYDSFDALPEDTQTEIMNRNLKTFAEETPVRVLKKYVSSDDYQRIIKQISRQM